MKGRTIEELLYDLKCWKGLLEHDYRREHKIRFTGGHYSSAFDRD